MSRLVTLTSLKEDIRQLYDLPAWSTTSFVTDVAVTRLINTSLQAYYAVLVECYGDDYFDQEGTITTVASVDVSSLPSTFVKLRKLVWVRGTNDVVTLRRADAEYAVLSAYASQSWEVYVPRYRLQSQTIKWYPTP